PVDAGIGPEVDQDDPAAELGRRQWRRVEPPSCAVQTRQVTFNRQLGRGVGSRADELVGSGEKRLPATWVLVHGSLLQHARRPAVGGWSGWWQWLLHRRRRSTHGQAPAAALPPRASGSRAGRRRQRGPAPPPSPTPRAPRPAPTAGTGAAALPEPTAHP